MRAVILAMLVACTTPDVKLTYAPADGTSQSCGTSNCDDVKIPCDAVVSIRIVSPDDPAAPHVAICEPLVKNRDQSLCALSQVDLGQDRGADGPFDLPKETLEVQILIWPREAVLADDGVSLDCGRPVTFDAAAGFPIAQQQQPTPAIGGRAFYHPDDSVVHVTLGCTDLPALNACSAEEKIDVSASVESFENLGVTVSINEALRYLVTIGEPKEGVAGAYTLNATDTRTLALTVVGVVPIWRAAVDLELVNYACVQVLEDAAQATAAVTCSTQVMPTNNALNYNAVSLPKATLDQILLALSIMQFPPNGMTVGIVVDSLFNPIKDQVVIAPGATVRYLSADRTSVGGTMTTTSGIFVSLDATFGTRFSTSASEEHVGGQIQGKVTVVVIQQ